jgi:hypothetical protein
MAQTRCHAYAPRRHLTHDPADPATCVTVHANPSTQPHDVGGFREVRTRELAEQSDGRPVVRRDGGRVCHIVCCLPVA